MLKKIFLITILVVSMAVGYTQPSYKKGYIIMKNSDTLKGYIYYNHINAPLFELKYKSSEKTAEKIIPSNNICCYWIKGEGKFISAPVLLLSIDIHPESNVVYKNYVPVMALLKELVKGTYYSLYKMEYEKNRFYICYEDTPRNVQELINIDVPGYFPVQSYRHELSSLLDNEDPFQEKIRYCEYEEKDLKKVVIYLNEGTGPIIKNKTRLNRWYIGTGTARFLPSLGSHFYTLRQMTPAFGLSVIGGFTKPWFNMSEKLISGTSLSFSALQSRYEPLGHDSGSKKNTHNIYFATLSTMITHRVLDQFHYRLYGGFEPFGQVGIFSPTSGSVNENKVWADIPRKTLTGLMAGVNAIVRVELPKISITGSFTLKTSASVGDIAFLDCKKRAIMLYYYF